MPSGSADKPCSLHQEDDDGKPTRRRKNPQDDDEAFRQAQLALMGGPQKAVMDWGRRLDLLSDVETLRQEFAELGEVVRLENLCVRSDADE